MAVSYKKTMETPDRFGHEKERLTTSCRSEFCTNSKVRSQ